MGRLLERNRMCTALDLHNNVIGVEGVRALARALRWNDHMRQVDVSRNVRRRGWGGGWPPLTRARRT